MLERVKAVLGISITDYDAEILGLIDGARADMQMAGIILPDLTAELAGNVTATLDADAFIKKAVSMGAYRFSYHASFGWRLGGVKPVTLSDWGVTVSGTLPTVPAFTVTVGMETDDAAVTQAILSYCRMHFGSPDDYDRLKECYDEQKAQLRMHTGHTDWGDDD